MGARLVMPEPDAKVAKAIHTFALTPRDIAHMFQIFQKLDTMQSGFINLEHIFKTIEMVRMHVYMPVINKFGIANNTFISSPI